MSEIAKVFEDRENAGDWRVEKIDDDGGCEVKIFRGPRAATGAPICRAAIRAIRRDSLGAISQVANPVAAL